MEIFNITRDYEHLIVIPCSYHLTSLNNSVMSRLRRLDKKIIDQHLDHDGPIDTDDQEQIIRELSVENRESYERGKFYIATVLLVELPLVIYASHISKSRGFGLVLVILSTMLSLIKLKLDEIVASDRVHQVLDWLNPINGVVCLPLVILLWQRDDWFRFYYLLPLMNLGNVVLFRWWFMKTAKDLKGLTGMKYKFKLV